MLWAVGAWLSDLGASESPFPRLSGDNDTAKLHQCACMTRGHWPRLDMRRLENVLQKDLIKSKGVTTINFELPPTRHQRRIDKFCVLSAMRSDIMCATINSPLRKEP